MALSFSTLTDLPTPPQKTDPDNFAARADAFVAALDDLQVEMNIILGELNTITSGLDQASTISAYSGVASYDFPDVVAGTDGYSYRCIDTGVSGQDPTTDDGTYWINLARGGVSWSVVNGSVSITNGEGFLVNLTTATITVTLPASPIVGTRVAVADMNGLADTYTITIARNGKNIMGVAENLDIDVANQGVVLVYSGVSRGWVIVGGAW